MRKTTQRRIFSPSLEGAKHQNHQRDKPAREKDAHTAHRIRFFCMNRGFFA
jgi:hypothetical protein